MDLFITIGTTNKGKIAAVKAAYKLCFPERKTYIFSYRVNSDVSTMPQKVTDLIKGSRNRAENALKLLIPTLDKEIGSEIDVFGVGLEGGIFYEQIINEWMLGGCVCVIRASDNKISYGKTASMLLPSKISKEVLSGVELSDVIDKLSGIRNTKEDNGAFGYLTNNLFTRQESFKQAIIIANAPFFMTNSIY
ncbi:MAG: inosine/xanthosine triphosphatase [Candidatus Thorarchaeota archaeon]